MSYQLQFVYALILISLISVKCDDSNEEPVELMTTLEPIDTADDLKTSSGGIFTTSIPVNNCSMFSLCDTCSQNNCFWETCHDVLDDFSQCSEAVSQNCSLSSCEHDVCKNVTDCEQCGKTSSCNWMQCNNSDEGPYCGKMAEICNPVACNATITTTAHPNDNVTTVTPIETTTVSPNDTTTTSSPDNTTTTSSPDTTTTSSPDTTTSPPDTTTTSSPDTTTTSSPDTTTSSPNTTTSPPTPDTTTSPPSPDTTTSSPSPDTTTQAPSTTTPGPAPTPAASTGGFSAGSFFGGITLTLALIAVGVGGYKFYKNRYDVNYRTL